MYRFASNTYALASLVAANLVTVYGVWFLDWHIFFIMLIYWCESAIIGAFTLAKIKKAEGKSRSALSWTLNGNPVDPTNTGFFTSFLTGFFLLHYGIFMLVHLVFLFAFFFRPGFSPLSFLVAICSLILSHFISYQTNFIQGREYQKVSPDRLFVAPYPRIIVMHLTVILGGGVALQSQDPRGALVLMVLLKIGADILSHLWEHGKFSVVKSISTSTVAR